MDYKDYYAALGVDRKASKDEIQKAYKKLARKLHPDVNKTPEAEARFKEVTEANEVLKNDEKRAKYDQFGSAWKQSQGTGGPPPGFEDIFSSFGQGGGGRGFRAEGSGFSSFFEALFGGGGGGRQSWQDMGGQAAPGADHEASISLSLEDAASGGQREITVGDPSTGRNRRLRVKVPAGVRSGQRIRLGGQGGKSQLGGAPGNLYLKVNLLSHPKFKLDGDKLRTHLEVSPAMAALGGEAEVATLNGNVRVRIPAGSSSGRKIRLRGKGYPVNAGAAGDLIAEIRVVVPSELSTEERTLYQQLADLAVDDPRPEEPSEQTPTGDSQPGDTQPGDA